MARLDRPILEFFKTTPPEFLPGGRRHVWLRAGCLRNIEKLGRGNLLFGGEAYHDDGPWTHPDNYYKFNGLLTYSQGGDAKV